MSLHKFGREFIGYGFGIGLTRAVSLLSLPLITTFFSKSEVGLIELSLALMSLLLVLINLGVDIGLTYYYWNTDNTNIRGRYISSAFMVPIFLTIVLTLCLMLAKSFLEEEYFKKDVSDFYLLFVLTIVIQAFFILSTKVMRIQRQVLKYNIVAFLNALFFLGMLYSLLSFEVNVSKYYVAKSVASIFAVAVSFFFIKKYLTYKPSLILIKQLLHYSIPLIPFAVVGSLMGVFDKLVINYFLTTEDVGIYGVGAKIGMVVGLFISAFSMAYGPYAMSIKNENNCRGIYSKLFSIYFFLVLGLVLIVAVFDDQLTKIFTAGNLSFFEARHVVAPIALSLVLHSMFSQLGVGLNITKNNHYFFYGAVVALSLNLILNILLVPSYGIVAAAYSSVAAHLVVCIWIYFVNNRIYPIPYYLKSLGLITLTFLTLYYLTVQGFIFTINDAAFILLMYFLFAGFVTFSSVNKKVVLF